MTRLAALGAAPPACRVWRRSLVGALVGALMIAGQVLVPGGTAEAQSLRRGDQAAGPATVVDGQSLDIKSDRFRLWGIDTPERGTSCYRNGRRWKPADDTAAALRRCVGGKTVTCRVWKAERKWFRDIQVSECWTDDGLDVGECMVRSGWATDYSCYSGGHYQDLETEARNKGIGLWSCDNGPGTRRWGRNGRDAPCETPRNKPTGPSAK